MQFYIRVGEIIMNARVFAASFAGACALTLGGASGTGALAAPGDDGFDDSECTDFGGATWCYSEDVRDNTIDTPSGNNIQNYSDNYSFEYSSNATGERFYYEDTERKVNSVSKDGSSQVYVQRTRSTYGGDQPGYEYECDVDVRVVYVKDDLKVFKDRSEGDCF